jgi:RHS repeat-associated protein
MGTEDVELTSTPTRYGIGARGIDVVSRTTSSGSQVSYPLYDGHGNNVGSLLKNGASFTVADEKTYDAWGALRSGGGTDKGKHCANLGHKQDDESGLVYMRARYYEPTSGRFVSQDIQKQGRNWFNYCGNKPISRVDVSGNTWADEADLQTHLSEAGFFGAIGMMIVGAMSSKLAMAVAITGFAFLLAWIGTDVGSDGLGVLYDPDTSSGAHAVRIAGFSTAAFVVVGFALRMSLDANSFIGMASSGSVGSHAVAVVGTYAALLGAFIAYEAMLP